MHAVIGQDIIRFPVNIIDVFFQRFFHGSILNAKNGHRDIAGILDTALDALPDPAVCSLFMLARMAAAGSIRTFFAAAAMNRLFPLS